MIMIETDIVGALPPVPDFIELPQRNPDDAPKVRVGFQGQADGGEEFALALEYMGKGLIDVKPLISATAPFTEAFAAFELATDRSRSMKVQLAF